MTRTWVQAEGGNAEENGRSNGSRRRYTAQGADTSGGRWWVAGVGDVHLNSTLHRERRWVAGVTESLCEDERLLVGGGGRKEEVIKKDPEMTETCGVSEGIITCSVGFEISC